MKVQNMLSSNGNKVANQFIISDEIGQTFQSYETTIARKLITGRIILDKKALNYSKTTSKYLYQFLGMCRKEVEQAIKDGTVVLNNLN